MNPPHTKINENVTQSGFSLYSVNEGLKEQFSIISRVCTYVGKTIPQVAIKWLLQKDVVPSVIIGATSVKQLEDNIGAASNWRLSKEQVLVLHNEL